MKKNRGFTLIEFILVSALTMIALSVFFRKSVDDLEAQKASIAGEQIAAVGDAVTKYIGVNLVPLSGAAFTDITVATLTGAGILPATFSATNAFGGAYTIRIKRAVVAPPRFEALITVPAVVDGTTGNPRLDLIGVAVSKIGAGGGVTYTTTTMSGASAGWTAPQADYPAITAIGQLGYFISTTGSGDNTYLRTDGGNSMAGTLNMGGQEIRLAGAVQGAGDLGTTGNIAGGTITGNSLTVTGNAVAATMQTGTIELRTSVAAGTACAPDGKLARTLPGAAMACVSGLWKKSGSDFWQDPVATYAALPVGAVAGEVRVVTDISRAFVWTGAAWVALAIDEAGNLTVPGTVTMADATVTSLSGYTSQTLSSLLPRSSWQGTYAAQDGSSIPKPACATGGTPLIFMMPQILDSADGVYNFRAISAGANWTTEIRTGGNIPQGQGRALAVTACAY